MTQENNKTKESNADIFIRELINETIRAAEIIEYVCSIDDEFENDLAGELMQHL